jgi:hypothetical protein
MCFSVLSLSHSCRAHRDLSTTSSASGAEIVVGPSASDSSILVLCYSDRGTNPCKFEVSWTECSRAGFRTSVF